MNKKLIISTSITAALYLATALPASANSVPDFGSCLNPQWAKTQENTGTDHGVAGIGTFAGVDTIYANGSNVLQCLCTKDGKGYQTNWLNAANLSQDTIDTMKIQGWIYIASGQDWGLQKAPYLAKNTEYTCASCTTTPTPTETTQTPTPTPTAVPGPTATPAPTATQSVASSLAPTGNALVIFLSILGGLGLMVSGIVLRKVNK